MLRIELLRAKSCAKKFLQTSVHYFCVREYGVRDDILLYLYSDASEEIVQIYRKEIFLKERALMLTSEQRVLQKLFLEEIQEI